LLDGGRLLGFTEHSKPIETFAATPAAVRPDPESQAQDIPKANRAGRAHLHGATRETLRDFGAAQKHRYQEEYNDGSYQDPYELSEKAYVLH
jgi:hypothetical protein